MKSPNENEEKQRWKYNFLFQNSIITGFILCERLNLGDSKYKYIAWEVLNIFCTLTFPLDWVF